MSLNKTTLHLPRTLVNKLMAHAQSSPDNEVCGLIGRDDTNHMSYYPVDNIAAQPKDKFLMDASQQINVMKRMRDKQQSLFAIVHSHPAASAVPSELDIQENAYKDAYYIIVSLNTRGVLEMRAWLRLQNKMQEVDLELESTD